MCATAAHTFKHRAVLVLGLVSVFALGSLAIGNRVCRAQPFSGDTRLLIVTSFPEDLYTRVSSRFQAKHPEIKVTVLNKKTAAAISYIQGTTGRSADLFWASAPDAFELLKEGGFLQQYRPATPDIAASIGGYPINDPDGYYSGFAISGYGLMWNQRYLKEYGLPPPQRWQDLRARHYFRHIGMSAPSRSGTTHMAVEVILQSQGWQAGWETLLQIGGNLATVTARSFGVPDGVKNGRFGIGIVIDFFGLSAIAAGSPVKFTYPSATTLVPANIALLNGARNPGAAKRFIAFLLSRDGQRLLFDPNIRRLPVMPAVYRYAPAGYPNPFTSLGFEHILFDSKLSKQRYHLVNALFDQMITYRHKALSKTWQAIYAAESTLAPARIGAADELLHQARMTAIRVPVSAEEVQSPRFTSTFERRRRGKPLPLQQTQLEGQWERFSRTNLKTAQMLVRQALSLLETQETASGAETVGLDDGF